MDDDHFHQEGLISEAIRRRALPADHAEHINRETYRAFMQAGIKAVEVRAAANLKALRKSGIDPRF